MSPTARFYELMKVGFPRVSGDEPVGRDSADDALAFSPRERG